MDLIRPLPWLYQDYERDVIHPQAGDWIEVADGILAMPFLQEDICKYMVMSSAKVPSLWQSLQNDPVPGDELRVNLYDMAIYEAVRDGLDRIVKPVVESRWRPATWTGLKDLFLIRYSKDRQGAIGLHNDRSHFSCSIVLKRACCGGELTFPRQNYCDTNIGVGWLIVWPAPITHPHMVQEVKRGRRVSMVVWTQD